MEILFGYHRFGPERVQKDKIMGRVRCESTLYHGVLFCVCLFLISYGLFFLDSNESNEYVGVFA